MVKRIVKKLKRVKRPVRKIKIVRRIKAVKRVLAVKRVKAAKNPIKLPKKTKGLTLRFIPYAEIAALTSVERIKKILQIVLKNKVVILQGRLKPHEETRLIEDTMVLVGNVKGFKGVELAVVSPEAGSIRRGVMDKMRFGIARALVGRQDVLTIIGPATIVKEIKKNPKKLEILMK